MTRFHLSKVIQHGPKVSARYAAKEELHAALRAELTPQRIEQLVAQAKPVSEDKQPWWV